MEPDGDGEKEETPAGFRRVPPVMNSTALSATTSTAALLSGSTRVYRLGPTTSAIAAAVESLYRDIEELRRTAAVAGDT